MPFCNNNNLFSNLPYPDWMQKPLQISEGGFPKGTSTFHVEHFNHVAISYANLLEQNEVLNGKNVHLPQEWFGTPKWPSFHCSGMPSIGKSGFRF